MIVMMITVTKIYYILTVPSKVLKRSAYIILLLLTKRDDAGKIFPYFR